MTVPDALVCLVDDDPAVLRGFSRLLRAWGYRVRAFTSVQEFLAFATADHDIPDCLLLDLHMPGLSGLELMSLLTEVMPSLPIVLLTGHLDPALQQRALDAGAVDCHQKPVNEQELLKSVARALERRARRR